MTSVDHPGWSAAVSSFHKKESHNASAISGMFFHWLCNLNSNFLKKNILGRELSMTTIGQLSAKLRFFSWWFRSLYARGYIPLGARMHPNVTNDYHFWSFQKGYLWRLPQHTQQIYLMLCLTYKKHAYEHKNTHFVFIDENSLRGLVISAWYITIGSLDIKRLLISYYT